MATQDTTQQRKIDGAVVHRGRTYTAGQEDALARALPAKDITRLVEKGTLSGNWTGAPTMPDAPSATAPAGSGEAPAATSSEGESAAAVAAPTKRAGRKTAAKSAAKRAPRKSAREK